MATRKLLHVARLLLAALVILLGQSAAHAGIFTITGGNAESIGDRGGTRFSNDPSGHLGQGLPTARGDWPNSPGLPPGFDVDTIYKDPFTHESGFRGISGFTNNDVDLTVYLDLARKIRFTWMGSGDANLVNSFWVFDGLVYTKLFETPPTWGDAVPELTSEVDLPAGMITFYWMTGGGTPTMVANGPGNANVNNGPSFFAGIDPYTASGTYQRTGNILYLGLSDSAGSPTSGDHDFQDLGVRLEAIGDPLEGSNPVPEPATLTTFLIGLAVSGGWALRSRRRVSADCH